MKTLFIILTLNILQETHNFCSRQIDRIDIQPISTPSFIMQRNSVTLILFKFAFRKRVRNGFWPACWAQVYKY